MLIEVSKLLFCIYIDFLKARFYYIDFTINNNIIEILVYKR